MSNALALAGVTAVLHKLLMDGFVRQNVSGLLGVSVSITVLAPDQVVTAGGSEETQVNLFLHRVTPNLGWRNEGLPSRDASRAHRLSNPPLALDLHYLLSAHGSEPYLREIVLGFALQLLHETPLLTRELIARLLAAPAASGALSALAQSGLEYQAEPIKITPEQLSTEELSKLWTAGQIHYRPTAAYLATVVLIESSLPISAALPVLSRGPVDPETGRDRGVVVEPSLVPPLPTIDSIRAANGQPAASVGGVLEITGQHLDGTGHEVVFSSPRFSIDVAVPVLSGASASSLNVVVPDVPSGVYQLLLRLVPAGKSALSSSNALAASVGPEITTALPTSVARDGAGTAIIRLSVRPQVLPSQQVSLILGTRAVQAAALATASSSLSFTFEDAVPGEQLVRLRVDGIESPLIDRAAKPPVFFNQRITIT